MPRAVNLALVFFLSLAGTVHAENQPLRDWFNDPFFQIADGMPGCPVPRGPLLTESEMKAESHSRAERGTTCWLTGACAEPNAYRYDTKIADHIRERVKVSGPGSLWITVKRRIVWVEGCVARQEQSRELEGWLKDVPDVERVLVDVMTGVEGRPPYRTLPGR